MPAPGAPELALRRQGGRPAAIAKVHHPRTRTSRDARVECGMGRRAAPDRRRGPAALAAPRITVAPGEAAQALTGQRAFLILSQPAGCGRVRTARSGRDMGWEVRAVAGVRRRRFPAAVAAALLGLGGLVAATPGAAAAGTSLEQAFDNVGITSPAQPGPGNFDGIGDSFSSTGLAADALVPGGGLLHDGLAITWPSAAPGSPDNVVAEGQTISLSGSGSALGIVGASAYGSASGTSTVTYTDGATSAASVSLADWINSSPAAGTDVLATTRGWNPGGSIPVRLSYAAVPIEPSKTVASVTLPAVSSGVGRGVTSMHVFDLTIGSPAAEATGAPGALSYYDEARKDCAGTAADTASKAWYTVADGELSDTYAPTIDNTDVKSLDPIVTGPGFSALQPRDMTYMVSSLGHTGMACRVIALDSTAHFAIVTDFVTDPSTEAVVMQYSLVPLPGAPTGLQLYLRFNPFLTGPGGGGSGNAGAESAPIVPTARGSIPLSYSTDSFTEALNRDYATPIYAAMAASSPFSAVETGFAGASSDGLNQLDASQSLSSTAPDASDGNVVQTVELTPSTDATPSSSGGSAASLSTPVRASAVSRETVALGFGSTESGALGSALQSSATAFSTTFLQYQQQWLAYDSQLCSPTGPAAAGGSALSPADQQAYWLSANIIKASEDKSFLGATAASLSSPWGQAVPAGTAAGSNLAPYFGSYREVFPRDAYETFTGFLVDGDMATARQMVQYWFDDMQLATGAFPRNGLLNGAAAPDTGGLQLDETAVPILAAWQAGMAGDPALYQNHIKPAADFLIAHGPSDGVERWEEQSGFSPSTMADEVAGLVAASAIAGVQGDTASARLSLASADDFRQLILTTDVTSNGPLSSSPYFIRLDMTRLGELPATDPTVINSLAVAAHAIDSSTPSGTGVLRYNGDGYGDCEIGATIANGSCPPTGEPWATADQGTGHPWPVLSGENGEYQLAAGDSSALQAGLSFMLNSASGVGLVPEQVWDYPNLPTSPYGSNPTTASIGFTDGLPDGSAAPLTWAQAQLVRLLRDMQAGTLLEQPSIVAQRYLPKPPVTASLSVSAPLAVSGGDVPMNLTRPSVTVNSSSTTVSGSTAPGATVDIAVTGTATGSATPTTTITTLTADSTGSFSSSVNLESGTNSVEVAATAGRATNEAIFTVNNLLVPGTVILNLPAAVGGGNGPGYAPYNQPSGVYAYPTNSAFSPDSLRLTGLTVIDSGSTVSFQIGIKNLAPTFGSLDGAQLIDLYIHAPSGQVPTGEIQSTAAASPFNYSIAPADAWNQAIEVDGFGGECWVTPSSPTSGINWSYPNCGGGLGSPQVSATQLTPSGGETPGVVTITVPASVLGAPSSTAASAWAGWTFTLSVTGQNGFGYYNARQFSPTPGDGGYSFGVCSIAETQMVPEPTICTPGFEQVDGSGHVTNVPYVMATIPPAGVNLEQELDPTVGPVVLQGVTVP